MTVETRVQRVREGCAAGVGLPTAYKVLGCRAAAAEGSGEQRWCHQEYGWVECGSGDDCV